MQNPLLCAKLIIKLNKKTNPRHNFINYKKTNNHNILLFFYELVYRN